MNNHELTPEENFDNDMWWLMHPGYRMFLNMCEHLLIGAAIYGGILLLAPRFFHHFFGL